MAKNTYYIPCCGSDCAYGYAICIGDMVEQPNFTWDAYINDILVISNGPSGYGNCTNLYGRSLCTLGNGCVQNCCGSVEYDSSYGRNIWYTCYSTYGGYYVNKYMTGGYYNSDLFPYWSSIYNLNLCTIAGGDCGCKIISQDGTANTLKIVLKNGSLSMSNEAYGETVFEIVRINLKTGVAGTAKSGSVRAGYYNSSGQYVGLFWEYSGFTRVSNTVYTMSLPAGSLFD